MQLLLGRQSRLYRHGSNNYVKAVDHRSLTSLPPGISALALPPHHCHLAYQVPPPGSARSLLHSPSPTLPLTKSLPEQLSTVPPLLGDSPYPVSTLPETSTTGTCFTLLKRALLDQPEVAKQLVGYSEAIIEMARKCRLEGVARYDRCFRLAAAGKKDTQLGHGGRGSPSEGGCRSSWCWSEQGCWCVQ